MALLMMAAVGFYADRNNGWRCPLRWARNLGVLCELAIVASLAIGVWLASRSRRLRLAVGAARRRPHLQIRRRADIDDALVLIGGMTPGLFTATEAATAALRLGDLPRHRRLHGKMLIKLGGNSELTATLFIVSAASYLGWS